MGKVTYETHPQSLEDWLFHIASGKIALPKFQRFEAWDRHKVRAFLQSIVDGLPTGAILLLRSNQPQPLFHWRYIDSAPEGQGGQPPWELILDGQQRLTALWKSITDSYEGLRYGVRVRELSQDDEMEEPFVVEALPYRRWMEQPAEWVKRGIIPVSLLNPRLSYTEVGNWRVEAAGGDLTLERLLEGFILELKDRFKQFNLPYIRLITDDPEAALAVFIHTNTKVTPLSPFDLVVAYFARPHVGVDLHELIGSLREEVPALKDFTQVDDLDLMRAAALLQDRRPTNKEVLNLDGKKVSDAWDRLTEGARRAFQFLQEERIFTGEQLPTEIIVPVLIALWAEAPEGGLEEGNARALLRSYIWHAFLSDRYDAATGGRAFEDYKALRTAIRDGKEGVEIPAMQATHPLKENDVSELTSARWPRYKDRLARAVFAVTLRGACLDLHDATPLTSTNVKAREYHHVFPKAFLRTRGGSEGEADRALNAILITRRTNRVIQAKDPRLYLHEVADNARLGEEELIRRLKSHLIPVDELLRGDYNAFLSARARLVVQGAKRLLAGEDWSPSWA
jgi:hypothetical protein